MSDLNLSIEDGVTPQDAAQVQMMNGADHSEQMPIPDPVSTPMPTAPQLTPLDFVLAQLPLPEQMGFLRGSIMMFSARLGTPAQQPQDADMLDQFNYLFQQRLREMVVQQQEQAVKQQADYENMQRQANEDAVKRGFKDANDMSLQMKTTYESISERVRQWHASTEPGGNELDCPDKDALLYDVYMVVEGLAR